MKSTFAILAGAAALILTGVAPQTAEAKIICKGRYQMTKHGPISTPYCEDNYLAAIAGYKSKAVRYNPSAKQEACERSGHDPRVRDICAGHNDYGDPFLR